MNQFIIDANIVVKWLVPGELEAEADRLFQWILMQDGEAHAPDFLKTEVAQVLWKKWRANELIRSEVRLVMAELAALPLHLHHSSLLLADAVDIACEFERTVYDSTYLALADVLDCDFISADERLINAMQQSNWPGSIRWLGEWTK